MSRRRRRFSLYTHASIALAQPRQLYEPGRTTVIYMLVDPRDGRARYVGKTVKGLPRRLREHLERPTNMHTEAWIRELEREGKVPEIVGLEWVEDREWEEAERGWIYWFRQRGPLMNVDEGGICRDEQGRRINVKYGPFQEAYSARNPHQPQTPAQVHHGKSRKKRKKGTRPKQQPNPWGVGKRFRGISAQLAEISRRQMQGSTGKANGGKTRCRVLPIVEVKKLTPVAARSRATHPLQGVTPGAVTAARAVEAVPGMLSSPSAGAVPTKS